MKAAKTISCVVIAISLVSCDLFLAPMGRRFNPMDPQTELVAVNLTIPAMASGHVWNGGAPRDFTSATFYASDNMYVGLLKFDTSGLPAFVTRAHLRLYAPPGPTGDVAACKIYQGWSESTIDQLTAVNPGFSSPPNNSPKTGITSVGGYFTWDITPFMKEGIPNGIAMRAISATTFNFNSGRAASNKPELVIEGLNYPTP